jgi:glycosyltransferase involved in cell wall biosynthesis
LVVLDGAIAAWLLGVPHLWHAREILDDQAPYQSLFGPCKAISIILALSQQVVATSEAVANRFRHCKNAEKVITIYNAVSLTEFGNVKAESSLRQEFNISDTIPIVAQIGNLVPIKGCEDFVHTAARVHQVIPEVIFLLIGGTPYPEYRQKVVDLINLYHLNGSFLLTDFRADMPATFSAINLLVQSSHYESFGRTSIEAMSAQKPVVGTRVGGIPEIIVDGVTGILVPPKSPDELAKAIISILNDPGMAKQMGQAGQERVQRLFSISNHVAEIEKVYRKLITQKKAEE